MVNTGSGKLLRVSELSRLTGVSTSAINYYVREGLLPHPVKTAPNMAYYDSSYVDMVNSIKILQREKGLSLAEIKSQLDRDEFSWPEGFPEEDLTGADGTAAGSRRALDRRKHIMRVAAKVFANQGYFTTTISDLAQAAGIAKGTIYWYFKNKREIMLAILEDVSLEIFQTFEDAMSGALDGLDSLLRCVRPALEMLEEHGPIYLMYFMEIGSSDEKIGNSYRRIYRVIHRGVESQLERGMEESVIRPLNPHLAAYMVMGIIERVSEVGSYDEEDKIPLDERAQETRELLWRALSSNNHLG